MNNVEKRQTAFLSLDDFEYIKILFGSLSSQNIEKQQITSDHGCTSRIYFDNAGDHVTLTLDNVTLTSQKPC